MPVCFLSKKNFVKFVSLEPEEDILSCWLEDLGVFSQETALRISEAKMYLPLDIEVSLREKLKLPLDTDCLTLLSKLLRNENGIELKRFGLSGKTCRDTETCTGRLNRLKLVRVQDDSILKPLKIAFDPRVQFLVGARKMPIL